MSAELVAWINLLGAFLSMILQGIAAVRGSMRARWLHAAIACVAGAYVAGYAWLVSLTPNGDIRHWSEVMRGVGPVAWIVAWWAPAVLSLHRHKKNEQAATILRRATEGS